MYVIKQSQKSRIVCRYTFMDNLDEAINFDIEGEIKDFKNVGF